MTHLSSYDLTYEYGDGGEDVHTIYAYSPGQAEAVAELWCAENGVELICIEKSVNYAQAI